MRSSEIAELLNVHHNVLSRKCSPYRGNFLCWLCREILSNAPLSISNDDRNLLLDILRISVINGNVFSGTCAHLFNNKLLGFESPILQKLAKAYSYNNPHNIKY